MSADPVARYLTAGRLTQDPGPIAGPAAHVYARSFQDILSRLDLAEHSSRPRLHVTLTANAVVETLTVVGEDVIVYDQYLGQSFNRLTDFALAEWPVELVIQWGMKHLAIALAARGAYWPSLAAHHLANEPAESERPHERRAEVFERRSQRVGIQEHFVLAHECVHAALRRGSLGDELRTSAEDLVASTVAAADSSRGENSAVVLQALVADEIDAINSGSRVYRISPEEHAELASRREHEHREREFVGGWVGERPYLLEEIVCDFIATDLTLARYDEFGVDAADVLEAILHGFHNHSSMEIIREHARQLTHGPRPAGVVEVAARKTVWRTAAPDVWGHYAVNPEPDEIRRRMVAVTELHSRTVGDQLLYTLYADFDAMLARVSDPPSVPRSVVVGLLLGYVDPTAV